MKSQTTIPTLIALGCLLGALGTAGCSHKEQAFTPSSTAPMNPSKDTQAQMAAKVQNPYMRQQFMNGVSNTKQ